MRLALAAMLIWAGLPAVADPLAVRNTALLCDRDVEVPVVIVTGPEDAVAILQIEGRQMLLYQEPAAKTGVRYSWPSGGASYVMWVKGEEATILWREAGKEALILTCTFTM